MNINLILADMGKFRTYILLLLYHALYLPEAEVLNMLLCIAASLLGIWGLAVLCKKIEQAGVRVKELAWLGSHSLLIYIYHMFFFWILSIITGKHSKDPAVWGKGHWFTCAIVLGAIALGRACMGNRAAEERQAQELEFYQLAAVEITQDDLI